MKNSFFTFFIGMLLLLTACSYTPENKDVHTEEITFESLIQTTEETTVFDIATTTVSISSSSTETNSSAIYTAQYNEVINEISKFMGQFKSIYTMTRSDDFDNEKTITKETKIDEKVGTNGVEITTYRESGNITRVEFYYLRETGQTKVNCYFLNDSVYVTSLFMDYSCQFFSVTDGDILSYSFF
jgi:hypothetical protein